MTGDISVGLHFILLCPDNQVRQHIQLTEGRQICINESIPKIIILGIDIVLYVSGALRLHILQLLALSPLLYTFIILYKFIQKSPILPSPYFRF